MSVSTIAHIGHGFLSTAYEGGIGYWARAYNVKREQLVGPLAMENFPEYVSMDLVEYEDAMENMDIQDFYSYDELDDAFERGLVPSEHVHHITANMLHAFFMGVINGDEEIRAKVGPYRSGEWVRAYEDDREYPDLDAEDCDVLVQLAAFGKVVYG